MPRLSSLLAWHDPEAAPPERRGAVLFLWSAGALLAVCAVFAIALGAAPVSPGNVLAILLYPLGIDIPFGFSAQQEAIVSAIRLPRALLGMLVGASLAFSGTIMQGLFRNPLADPTVVGVSGGAAVAAVSVIVLGQGPLRHFGETFGLYALPVASFAGSLISVWLVYRIATLRSHTDIASLLLAGIAVNAIAVAGIGLLSFLATDEELRSLTFWSLGSLGRATWPVVTAVAPLLVLLLLLSRRTSRDLNALVLGEAEAGHLGIRVQRTKHKLILLVALAVGAAVSVSGMVGFVGLIVPHVVRLVTGPDHRYVIPGSLLLGASLMLGADLMARLIVAPAELPLGIVTAALGGPFFLGLLIRRGRGDPA